MKNVHLSQYIQISECNHNMKWKMHNGLRKEWTKKTAFQKMKII